MSNHLLEVWHSNCSSPATLLVFPDGCQDLIVRRSPLEQPVSFVSPLFDSAKTIELNAGTSHTGFRFKPGVRIQSEKLLAHIGGCDIDENNLTEILDDFTARTPSVDEALGCLASGVDSVQQACTRLGVGIRTLQRLVRRGTDRSPVFWLQLARVRRTARSLSKIGSLAELAECNGYSDQSHMNREFARWFRCTPTGLKGSPELLEQFHETGYA